MAKYVQPNFIVDSSASFLRNVTFDSSVYLQGVTHINAPATVSSGTPYALVLETGSGNDLTVKSKLLGTMAFETAATWDASLLAIRTNIDYLETSVGALDTLTQSHTAKLAVHEASIGVLTQKDLYIDSSLNALWTNQLSQDASIVIERQKWIDSNRTGFLNQTETTLAFTSGTPTGSGTFTLGDSGSGWSYYRDGIKYTISGPKTIPLNGANPASAGRYFITIEGTTGDLTISTTPWSLDTQSVLVAYVDWDPSNTPTYAIGEERHTMLIDRQIHKYLHETQGTKFVSGGTLTGPDVAAGDVTVTDASNAVGISATEIADEDLFQTLPALTRPDGLGTDYWVFTRNTGNLSDWKLEATPLPEGASYIQYDNGTSMVEATPGKYVNSYIMFTNLTASGSNPRFAILPGQAQFDTLDAAIDENPAAFNFTGLPVAEYVIAWQLTWEASTGYTTDGKVALASAPKRIEVNATTASQVTTEAHNDLIGLQGGTATERYHLTAAQWTDYAGKAYVDGSIAALKSYTDSSLGARDTSIAYLNTQRAQLDASIVRIDAYQVIQDSSIAAIGSAWKPYVDGSLGARDTSIAYLNTQRAQLDASIVRIDAYQVIQDASIALKADKTYVDGSLGARDTSIAYLNTQRAQLDASIVRIDAYQVIQDSSIAAAGSSVKAWNGLVRVDNSIGLGGTGLVKDTVIYTNNYQLAFDGTVQITGNLTVDGSITYINTTELDVSDNIIQINTGLTGVPPTAMVSGMKVNRGSSDPYFFIFSEADDTFRIGINASEGGLPAGTQAVATREDSPIATAVPFWNSAQNRFDTDSDVTFAVATGLDVDNRITANLLTLQNIPNLTGEATALVIASDGSVGYRELSTGAFANIADYATLNYVDGSLGARDTSIAYLNTQRAQLDASIVRIDAYQVIQDASIAAVGGAWKPYVDSSLGARDTSIAYLNTQRAQLDASIVRIDAYQVIQDSSIALKADKTYVDGSIASLKTYVDGSLGARDTSISWLNTNKLSLSGGTMTGLLTLAAQGILLDGVTITAIDTSLDGLGQLDTAIPTSGAVSKAIAAAIASGVTASNGLTENPAGNIKLGGTLTESTTIDLSTGDLVISVNNNDGTSLSSSFTTSNITLQTEDPDQNQTNSLVLTTGDIALKSDDGGAYGPSSVTADASTITIRGNLILDTNFDAFDIVVADTTTGVGIRYTGNHRDYFVARSLVDKGYVDYYDDILEASIVRIDSSLNDTIDLFEALDASFGAVWTAIDNLESSVGALDTLTQTHTAKLAVHEASIGFLRAYDVIQDASIAAAGTNTKAWNGLTKTDSSIGLGGPLVQPTVITASAANTLTLAGLQTSAVNTPLALVQDTADTSIRVRQLGTMAWATTTDYTLRTLFDSSLSAVWTKFGHVDTSLNNIWTEFGYVDTSLANIWTKFGYVDSSLATFNTWNQNQDASIAALSTAQGNYVLKSGDTMTGPLTISAGGLSVTNDVSISGNVLISQDLIVTQDAFIGGSLTIDGSLYVVNVETIDVSAAFIHLNTGLTGTPPATLQSGLVVGRGSLEPYVFLFDETLDTFRIGIATETSTGYLDASTQAVATRQDSPEPGGVAFWNPTEFRFDTDTGFYFDKVDGLGLDVSLYANAGLHLAGIPSLASEATALVWDGNAVGYRELGSNAFTSTVYAVKADVDSSLATVWTKLGYVDTSLNNLGIKNASQDSSIAALDLLTQSHTQSITDLSTNKLDAVANTTGVTGTAQIFSTEANNVAYLKQIIAGTGATITQDSSTITIAVAGAAGYVSKYRSTFDGTSGTSFTIAAGTHALGTGPFTVTVYENDEQVYTGVECQDDGDVVLTWSPGSLVDASCKFIITG